MQTRRVAIAGVGLSDCGRVPDKTALHLMHQATTRAIADCGLEKGDIEGFGGHGVTLAPLEISESLGLRPSWIDSTNVGGSSWEIQAQHAAAAIACGEIDVAVLAYGATPRSDVKLRGRNPGAGVN